MLSCTGNALVCLYCTRPNRAPTPQSKMPRYISISPLMPPNPANLTSLREGILMSASPANTLVARPNKQNAASAHKEILVFFIKRCRGRRLTKLPIAANHFWQRTLQKLNWIEPKHDGFTSFRRIVRACCPNGTERGCPTRSSQKGQMSAQNSTGFGVSNVLQLGQPRSAPSPK